MCLKGEYILSSRPINFPEEIFRFSVVRNPLSLTRRDVSVTVVDIIDHPSEEYIYYTVLVNLRKDGSYKDIITEASRMINAPEFMDKLELIFVKKLWHYVERLQALPNLTLSSAVDLLEEVYNMNADEVADLIRDDKVVISDSLVLASVVPPPVPGLRTRLMSIRRVIAFIDRLANSDVPNKAGSEKVLNATLLLPKSIFPLPESDREKDSKKKKVYSHKKAVFEKKNARAQELMNKLSEYASGADELSECLSSHLFEMKFRHPIYASAKSSLTVLPSSKVATLSSATKKIIIDELSIPETAIDVPYVVSQIEQANRKLGKELITKFGGLFAENSQLCFLSCNNIGECKGATLPPPNPDNDFTPDTRGKVEIVGIQDLLIVRQSLFEYRAGEISHIENVLKSEEKGTTYRKLNRTEVETVQEIEKEQIVENELQTTDKYELQSEVSKIIQDDKRLEAGVTVTASYGTLNIETHGSYASNTSSQESQHSASTFARDVISRSVQRIRERILNRVRRTEITEIEITNLHKFLNTGQDAENISGIYRWVDKFYKTQIVNYGKRLMLEFVIPEPAAFYKYALNKKPLVTNVPEPERPGFCCDGEFYPLSPDNLQPENYLCFVAKYNVKNISQPPPKYLWISDVLIHKIETTNQETPVSFAVSNGPASGATGGGTSGDTFKIPEGYMPKMVNYNISGSNTHSVLTTGPDDDGHDDNMFAQVTIANQRVFRYYKNEIGEANGIDLWPDIKQVVEWGNQLTQAEIDLGSYVEGPIQGEVIISSSSDPGAFRPDTVKVSLTGYSTMPISVAVYYIVLCECSTARFQKWQLETFNAIMAAYELLKQDYDDALLNQQNEEEKSLQDRNPLINREIEKHELKKFSISLLTGQQYESFNAMEYDYETGIPQIDLSDAAEEGKFVRFFEQALEWINITYLFYPYFWGRKTNWAETIMIQNTDPLFEQFLHAGYSRVWVPVRPGFEPAIINYIKCGGEPWNERDAPIVGGESHDQTLAPTVALIDEIKEQLGVNFEFRPGTIKVEKASNLIVGDGTDFRFDDVDREILIELRYYRIQEVDEASQEIRLREKYLGEDRDKIGFAIGVKFVGEPWLVQVPTSLVYLSSRDDIVSESHD
jgi:hypothetical protein